jgi:DNA-binding LacI/PurR family transcriptional regulator/signal transduction histidine kinase/DNA-binding NarL/FixJ family response regulator
MKDSHQTKGKTEGRELTIALLGTNLSYEIPISIFRTTRELIQKQNFKLLYFSGEAYKSPHGFDSQANILYNLINTRITDGMIIISNLLGSFTSLRELSECCRQFQPLPVVSLGMAIEGIPSVIPDNMSGMYDAVCHLIEVHHHSRIAFLRGPQKHPDVTERFAAFTRAMETHGLPVDENLLLEGNFEHESGIAAVRELIDNRGRLPGRDVQAIVCCNDYMASGVMLELQRRGIPIPDQVALVGFDNIHFSECLFPPLSTVHYPFDTLAAKSTDMLITLIEGKTVPELVPVSARFIPRRSCGCTDVKENADTSLYQERLQKIITSQLPENINNQIIKSVRPTLMAWKPALTHLYREGKLDLFSGAENSYNNGKQTVLELLGRIADYTFSSSNYQTIIHNIGSALTSTLELSELFNILARLLPMAKIGRCCICLYENPGDSTAALPQWSRLVFAFSLAGPEELPPGGLRFPTTEFLPAEIVMKHGRKSWVILPLYFKWEQIGYMLMDSEAPHEYIHWNFRNQISTALKGARLLEETCKANKQKTQFFINVAHETKTPLTLIHNYLALYLEQHEPDEKLLIIKQNIDLLLANMLNFLDAERLQKGAMIYQHDTLVDLSENARRKYDIFRVIAEKKDICITCNAENHIIIRIDPWALDRIFNNLLDNATKYTQRGGRIKLEVFRDRGKAILRISDNGPGLHAETCEHIFEPYYLLSKKKNRQQGIGVGLSIVKKIVDGLGAAITVEKSSEGGTCFTIAFTDESSAVEQESLQEFQATVPTLPPVQENIEEINITADKQSIFIIDDNIQLLKLIQDAFSESYNIFLARNTAEALIKIKIIPRPDLIISDIMMDGEDGFQLLSTLSKKEGYNNIPFVFLTALSGEKAKLKGLDIGAIDYIEKPFSIPVLRAKIESIIALRERHERQIHERIRNRIDGLLTDPDNTTTGFLKSRVERLCEDNGIVGQDREIIRMLADGLMNKEIAANMNVSLRSVEYHITKIYQKIGVTNKYDLLKKIQGLK